MGDVSFTSSNLQDIADTLEKDREASRGQDVSVSDDQESESYSLEPLTTSMMRMRTFVSHKWAAVDNVSRLLWRVISLEFLRSHSSQATESWSWT